MVSLTLLTSDRKISRWVLKICMIRRLSQRKYFDMPQMEDFVQVQWNKQVFERSEKK